MSASRLSYVRKLWGESRSVILGVFVRRPVVSRQSSSVALVLVARSRLTLIPYKLASPHQPLPSQPSPHLPSPLARCRFRRRPRFRPSPPARFLSSADRLQPVSVSEVVSLAVPAAGLAPSSLPSGPMGHSNSSWGWQQCSAATLHGESLVLGWVAERGSWAAGHCPGSGFQQGTGREQGNAAKIRENGRKGSRL